MNLDEREEGELTEYEYEDISSDEELLLKQRIAEIEATNLELEQLASLSRKVDEEEIGTKTKPTATEIVALTTVKFPSPNCNRRERRLSGLIERSRKQHRIAAVKKPAAAKKPTAAKPRRRRSRRIQACHLIVSDDEFGAYDALPLGSESLSPTPLPETEVNGHHTPIDEEDDDDVELKLRLEALQSKQEIKNDLRGILSHASVQEEELPPPPVIDEEQELRLIALKSAIVKKHLVRKKRREEARPYSPTDALENFEVPSPPLSAQNMDISPFGTPSPFSENNNAVDMDIANEESQSPIFFSCTVVDKPMVAQDKSSPEDMTIVDEKENTDTQNGVAPSESRIEIKVDRSTLVADSGYDDEDPDKLRAFLLQKIEEAATRKSMQIKFDIGEGKKVLEVKNEDVFEKKQLMEELSVKVEENDQGSDDEHVLRANLLSKAKRFQSAKSEKAVMDKTMRPLSEILSERSKKIMDLKSISRTIANDNVTPVVVESLSPKAITPTRNALISQMRTTRVTPVIISLKSEDSESDFCTDHEENNGELVVHIGDNCNDSPLSIAMDSPGPPPVNSEENFDAKLSEFLKKARQSTGNNDSHSMEGLKRVPMKRIVTSKKIVKKVINTGKAIGLESAIKLGAPAAVKHLPPSTQLEYNRLINRMHQLERQKLMKAKREQPKRIVTNTTTVVEMDKGKPSPVKAPPPPPPLIAPLTVLRRMDFDQQRLKTTVVNNKITCPKTDEGLSNNKTVPGGGLAEGSGGRITLKDRLRSLTGEQMKMLLDVQQRKVANKRKLLNHSLDAIMGTLNESMAANRQQIRTELEVRRLRKLLRQKEQSLEDQRKLCNGAFHEKLQAQYKQMIVARQSLTTVTSQCMEIGRSAKTMTMDNGETAEEKDSFRLTEEGALGLGAKFRQCKGEIEAYKELRQKVKKGIFTVADIKVAETKVAVPVEEELPKPKEEIQEGREGKIDETEETVAVKEDEEEEKVTTVADTQNNSITDKLSEPPPPARESPVVVSLLEYKSPLEHMEFLDTANPNGILCPFQLNGTCQDEECSYRHLLNAPSVAS